MHPPDLQRTDQLRKLRDILVLLYPNADDAQRLAADSNLPGGALDLNGTAVNIWHKLLAETEKHHKTTRLLDLVQTEYPDNVALTAACQTLLVTPNPTSITPSDPPPSPTELVEVALPATPCPYRGLEPFEAEHVANYFGREAMVQKLVEQVGKTNFVAVVGPSGSGKSSLVRAGLVTALRNGALPGSREWQWEILRPGDDPLRALATPLVARIGPELKPVDHLKQVREMADSLQDGSLRIGDVLAELRSLQPGLPRLLLVFDQFEETFTLCADETVRRAFLSALVTAAETPWFSVILTVRADFFGHLLTEARLGQRVDGGQVNVLPMTSAERRRAIEQPALNAGRHFEEGLVQRILDAIADEPGELPLLEFALTELWERQTPAGLLTHAAYAEIGEVTGAIARRADQTLHALPLAEQRTVQTIFTRLVRVAPPDEGAEDTKRRMTLSELAESEQTLVRLLADARLLVTDRDAQSGVETIEVAHEALIRNWQALQQWLNGDREFLLWRQRLRALVTNWLTSQRDEGALLRGALLSEANGWLQTRPRDLSEQERAFVVASQQLAQREEAEKEAARQRELTLERGRLDAERRRAEEQLLANSQLRRRAIWLGIALLLAVMVAGVAFYYYDRAQRNAELATQKLAELAGDQLLKEARSLKTASRWAEAIAKFEEADKLALRPSFDLQVEKEDVIRQEAIGLVQEGEKLALQGDVAGAAAKYQAALDLNPPSDTPVYVRVPAGPFPMGSNDGSDDEKPQHTVTLDEFWILRTEVTNSQYQECVAAKGCDAPVGLSTKSSKLDKWPVVNVTWQQAQQYATWKGGRLPTEAEWEKACRGDQGTPYPWGNEPPTPELANFGYNEGTWTVVGSYPPGNYGLFDMAGNVWEWTADWYDEKYYATSPPENPKGPEKGDYRTLRGGSFNYSGNYVRCASRGGLNPSNRTSISVFGWWPPAFDL